MTLLKKLPQQCIYLLVFSFISLSAHAGTINNEYPWDEFFDKVVSELQSNFALFIGIAGLVICAGMVMFGDLQGGARKAFNVGLGISIAFNAATILSKMFGQGALLH